MMDMCELGGKIRALKLSSGQGGHEGGKNHVRRPGRRPATLKTGQSPCRHKPSLEGNGQTGCTANVGPKSWGAQD